MKTRIFAKALESGRVEDKADQADVFVSSIMVSSDGDGPTHVSSEYLLASTTEMRMRIEMRYL